MLDKVLQGWLQSQLFEQVPCNIAVINKNYTIVDHNRNFQELFGPGKGKACYDVYKKRSQPCEQCMAAKSFVDGKVRVNDEVGADLEGRTAYYLVHIVPIVTGDGEIPYIVEMSTDISETKRLQREYQILFEKVPCYVTTLNRDFRIVRANDRVRETFGAAPGKYCWEIFKRQAEKCSSCPAEITFADGETHSAEHVGINKDGEKTYYIATSSPLSGSEPLNHVIEIAVDVTRLHQLEEEKIEAERLAAVGQTVAGLAHGIKNILTGLVGGQHILNTGLERDDRERIDEGWGILNRNIDKVSALVKNLLSFSKGETQKVRLVKPWELAYEVVELYRDTAEQQNIELKADCDERIKPAYMDPEGIHDCLANLVSNAIDACQMSEGPICDVLLRCREEGENIIFEVEDTGCGVDCEVKHKVFTNFFTTKGNGGTGLGLLLTRKITQEHGGKVSIESIPGQGSSFRLVFPRNRLPKPDSEAPGTPLTVTN